LAQVVLVVLLPQLLAHKAQILYWLVAQLLLLLAVAQVVVTRLAVMAVLAAVHLWVAPVMAHQVKDLLVVVLMGQVIMVVVAVVVLALLE
jgi:hypothetical protein